MGPHPSTALRARLGSLLVEPWTPVHDAVERRRAHLLATLTLVQAVQMVIASFFFRATEVGAGIAGALVLPGIASIIAIAHVLARQGKTRRAAQVYIGANLATNPVFVMILGASPDLSPELLLLSVTFPVLLVNAFASARATVAVGAIGIVTTAGALFVIAPASLSDEVREGAIVAACLTTLIVVLGVHRDRVEADRSAELRTRNDELEALRRSLEERVLDRTRALSARNQEMQLVLDSASQGLFTVDLAGYLTSRPSAALLRWMGEPRQDDTFFRYLGRQAPTYGARAELGWAQVLDGVLPVDMALDQLPPTFSRMGRTFRVGFQSIAQHAEGGAGAAFLVVVSDVTAELDRDKLVRERREASVLFEHLARNRAAVIDFLDAAGPIVDRILAPSDRRVLGRDVHTLKGDALTFGLESIGAFCHDVESRLGDSAEIPETGALRELWMHVAGDVQRLLGDTRRTVDVSPDALTAIERSLRDRKPHDAVLAMVTALRQDEVAPRLERLGDSARKIAERQGKKIQVKVCTAGTRVRGRQWSILWTALVHAVRNAVDHGLELPEERTLAGKKPEGQLWLRATSEPRGGFTIEIQDDGRGIDWDAVRARAVEAGVAGRDAVDDLFTDGLSTAESVTELSGRGLGMGALRDVVTALGGNLRVESERERGTLLRLVFPSPSVQARMMA